MTMLASAYSLSRFIHLVFLLFCNCVCKATTGQSPDIANGNSFSCDEYQAESNGTDQLTFFDPRVEFLGSNFGSVYQCVNGSKVFIGCWARSIQQQRQWELHPKDLQSRGVRNDDVKILTDGDTLIWSNYWMQCQNVSNVAGNGTAMVKIGCYVDNRILAPGQIYVNGSEYFACQSFNYQEAAVVLEPDGRLLGEPEEKNDFSDIVFEKAGCVNMYGQMTKLNHYDDIGDYRYVCIADSQTGRYRLVPDACLINDVAYKPNDVIVIADFWYECRRSGDHLTVQPRGCVVEHGFQIHVGDLFHSSGFIRRCELIRNHLPIGGDRLRKTFWGCLGKPNNSSSIIEYPLGAKWIEGSSEMFEVTCSSPNGIDGVKAKSRCALYNPEAQDYVNQELVFLNPNHFTRIGKLLWACRKSATNQLTSTVLRNAGMQETTELIMEGFQYSLVV